MKRKIENALNNWKKQKNKKPLLIQGARQVGKTYSVKKFGVENFGQTIYLNFEEDLRLKDLFKDRLNPEYIISLIEILFETKIDDNTLIIFDEVQTSERALTSLKYFEESKFNYNLIATGSLLGIHVNRNEYSFPVGKVEMLTMYPLDFEEFLHAQGKENLANAIRDSYDKLERFPLHDVAMEEYKKYLIVGGMPEVVKDFIEHNDYSNIKKIQSSIINAYIADMQNMQIPVILQS